MTTSLMPEPRQRYYTNLGAVAAGYLLYTYAAGTTTLKATYQDSAGTVPNTNPIVLDAKGEATIYWSGAYKVDLKTATGVPVTGYPVDNYVSIDFILPAAVTTLRSDLAASTGSALVGFMQTGAGAQPTDNQTVLRESISVFRFMTAAQIADVKARTMLLDVTAAINAAIAEQVLRNGILLVPAGTYKVTPATVVTDEAGATTVAFTMASNMNIAAEKGAIFKIADGVSTDAAPKNMRMFFSNQFLSNIAIKGLVMDMNGANNKISPNRATFVFNRWTQAHICFSGTPGGIAAGASKVVIDGCEFINGPGVSCIVMAQSNTVGVTMGKGWTLTNNTLYNNGLDVDDHSSVFGWATDVMVFNNTFDNPAMFNNATKTGGLVAYEIHGSRTTFLGNIIKNYAQGLWVGTNLTEAAMRGTRIIGNFASVSVTFSDFFSGNLTTGASNDAPIEHVLQTGNTIEITNDAVSEQVKAFFKIASRKQPTIVLISDNICRSFETVKNVVLSLVIVSPNQLVKGNQITIERNKAAGISAGLVTYFSGNGATALTQNLGIVTFAHNDLGFFIPSPGGLYQNVDVVLYGPNTGIIEQFRVYGLQTLTTPISVDAPVGGRATVYGKALIPITVTWNGLTAIGNGTVSKKISLDTDAGFAAISLQLACGSTTTTSGNIYPSFTGLTADSFAAISGLANYPASSWVLAGRADNTGNFISMYSNAGTLTAASPAAFVANSGINISGHFPCSSAAI